MPCRRRKRLRCRKPRSGQAAPDVGVDAVEFLDYPDGVLTESVELRRDITTAPAPVPT